MEIVNIHKFNNLNTPKHSVAVKTITVTEEAYNALASLKRENESFSKTILRIGKKRSIMDFYGILSKEEGERMKERLRKNREEDIRLEEEREELLYGRWKNASP
jgi:predicted CopG family antitoxin